ncbi:hypothetical protein CDD83_8683 [Cordyceps sp. RAO-2017]|nr:hypothetical protein CDD83_8683 [Cordyceps sp. RAO-2017]
MTRPRRQRAPTATEQAGGAHLPGRGEGIPDTGPRGYADILFPSPSRLAGPCGLGPSSPPPPTMWFSTGKYRPASTHTHSLMMLPLLSTRKPLESFPSRTWMASSPAILVLSCSA